MNTLYELGVRKLADKVINVNYTKESIVRAILPVFVLLPHILGRKGERQQHAISWACTIEPCVNTWKKPMKVKYISVHFKAGRVFRIILYAKTSRLVITIGLRRDRFIVDYYSDVMIGDDPSLLYLKKFFKNIWR